MEFGEGASDHDAPSDDRLDFFHETMPPRGSQAGRNHAIHRTTAEICIFVDDDVRLPPSFVAHHQTLYAKGGRERVDCVAGRVVQPLDGLSDKEMIFKSKPARYSRFWGFVSGNFFGFQRRIVDHMHECNFSVRTELLKRVGAFSETFLGNAYFEGTDLALRLQAAQAVLHFEPSVALIHLQEGMGGNRVFEKSVHTYWFFRNLTVLNRRHLSVFCMPFYVLRSLLYICAKGLKNADLKVTMAGLTGLKDGFFGQVPKV